jgi:hypothetical protein
MISNLFEHRKCLLYIFFILSFHYQKIQAIPVTTWTLNVGEWRELGSSIKKIHLTRRAVVQAVKNEQGVWQVGALRKGYVILSYFTDREQKQIAIYVKNREEFFPEWVCNKLICDSKNRQVSGTSSNHKHFFMAKKWCSKHMYCIFTARLAKNQQIIIEKLIRKRAAKALSIEVSRQGEVSVKKKCVAAKDKIDFADIPKEFIVIKCVDIDKEHFYEVVIETWVEKVGTSAEKDFNTKLVRSIKDFKLTKSILSLSENDRKKTNSIYRTVQKVKTILGKETLVSVGSDIETNKFTSRGKKIFWKKTGASFKFLLSPKEDKLLVNYTLKIRHPSYAKASNIHTNTISSYAFIKEEVVVLLCSLKVKNSASLDNWSEFFRGLPILSPFFIKHNHASAHAKISLTIQAKKIKLDLIPHGFTI